MAGWVSLLPLRPCALLRAFGSRSLHGSCLAVWFRPAAALLRHTYPSRCWGGRGLFTRGGGTSVTQLTLEDIARSLQDRQHKRVVVMAGAGISTPSGIPDFRSPGSGLYDNLQQYDLPYAEAIFEIGFFQRNPAPFFALAKELYPGNYRPNLTHFFVHLLHQKGQLLRMYTQNIDGLERLAGIPPEKLVEAHGTFATATCTSCLQKYKGEELHPAVMRGSIPKCSICGGVVKPDIVFFGEELPPHFLKYLTDFPLADLLIIMGTSLETCLPPLLRPTVVLFTPCTLLVNRTNGGFIVNSDLNQSGGAFCQFGGSRSQLRAPLADQQGPCGTVCVGAAPSGRGAAGGGGGRCAGAGGGSGLDSGAVRSDGRRCGAGRMKSSLHPRGMPNLPLLLFFNLFSL